MALYYQLRIPPTVDREPKNTPPFEGILKPDYKYEVIDLSSNYINIRQSGKRFRFRWHMQCAAVLHGTSDNEPLQMD